MNILLILLTTILCTILYLFVNAIAIKKAKDLFGWGYITGIVIAMILDILFKFI